jgi:hypothetical protein
LRCCCRRAFALIPQKVEKPTLTAAISKEYTEFRLPGKVVVPTADFQPLIYSHTYKLAQRKERKEREEIEKLLLQQSKASINSELAEGSDSKLDSANIEPQLEDVAMLPPPPPSPSFLKESTKFTPGTSHSLQHTDVMYARGMLGQLKKERLANEIVAQQLKECTFHPKLHVPQRNNTGQKKAVDPEGEIEEFAKNSGINGTIDVDGNSVLPNDGNGTHQMVLSELDASHQSGPEMGEKQSVIRRSGSRSVHLRLYNLKDKQKSSKLSEPSMKMIEEMQACTFAPQLRSSFHVRGEKHYSSQQVVAPTEKAEQGFDKSVQRIQKANAARTRQAIEEGHERQKELLHERYLKSRELARQGAAPFNFLLQNRPRADENKKEKSDPK